MILTKGDKDTAVLDDLTLIHQRDSADMLGSAARKWASINESAQWRVDRAVPVNYAKQLALELMGKTVVVHGSKSLSIAVQDWKRYINTNAHQLAWVGQLDDASVLGWTSQPVNKQYALVELRSSLEGDDELRRFETVGRILSGRRPAPTTLDVAEGDETYQLSYAQALGEFVSLYLAMLNGVDPAKQAIIDKINGELA